MQITEQIVVQLLSDSALAVLLLYFWRQERKERRELQKLIFKMLQKTANLGESTRDSLKGIVKYIWEERGHPPARLARPGAERPASLRLPSPLPPPSDDEDDES